VNDADCAARAAKAARTAVGADRVDGDYAPVIASEDFGVLARLVPACLAFLGNGTVPRGQGGTALHTSDYAFNDHVLGAGVAFCVQVVRDSLCS
jgi:metal-dependent amidase/aminoacylase/carboxypeptidase family protein